MLNEVCTSVIQDVIDSQKDLVAIFHENDVVMINQAFKNFFSVSSLQDYQKDFGAFEDNFVPHPSYFNKDKIHDGELWFESAAKLPESERIVSMMTPSFEPHAFSLRIDDNSHDYRVISMNNITQTLIKRIMIENNANMDIHSGAYSKEYFLHISKSYEDAAIFNEKILALITIDTNHKNPSQFSDKPTSVCALVTHFKNSIRQDDMLIRWDNSKFVLIFIVDCADNAHRMFKKLQNIVGHDNVDNFECKLNLHIQEKDKDINYLISKIDEYNNQ